MERLGQLDKPMKPQVKPYLPIARVRLVLSGTVPASLRERLIQRIEADLRLED